MINQTCQKTPAGIGRVINIFVYNSINIYFQELLLQINLSTMKQIFVFLILIANISFCHAQYSKDKLTQILTDGNVKSWTAKKTGVLYAFNKNMTVEIKNDVGTGKTGKWALSSADNIRWFISINDQKYELIVSYDKAGKQYIKLNSQGGDSKASGYSETVLYPQQLK
jgi:hypothetical protein